MGEGASEPEVSLVRSIEGEGELMEVEVVDSLNPVGLAAALGQAGAECLEGMSFPEELPEDTADLESDINEELEYGPGKGTMDDEGGRGGRGDWQRARSAGAAARRARRLGRRSCALITAPTSSAAASGPTSTRPTGPRSSTASPAASPSLPAASASTTSEDHLSKSRDPKRHCDALEAALRQPRPGPVRGR